MTGIPCRQDRSHQPVGTEQPGRFVARAHADRSRPVTRTVDSDGPLDRCDTGSSAFSTGVVAVPSRAAGRDLTALRRQLIAGLDQPGGLVLDGRQVKELSPAAQAVLVASRRTARLRGLSWRLAEPTAAMTHALKPPA